MDVLAARLPHFAPSSRALVRIRCPAVVSGSILCCARFGEAQAPLPLPAFAVVRDSTLASSASSRKPSPPLLDRSRPPFVRAMLAAVAASSVVSLGDGALMREVAKMRAPDSRLNGASTFCSSLGGGVPLSVGLALWAGGAATHRSFVQRLGKETTESVMLSGALTIGIKGLIGRTRPNSAPDDPDRYYPGRGFFDSQRASFPSGHTSAAFAVATVLSRELSARHPSRSRWIRGAFYGGATAVGLARVYQNAHWPSDVVTGAALGTLSGLRVLSWHPGAR
jgi:membrane-associated phospholipid phosphatase